MKLVLQGQYRDACQQACIAMLTDLPIETVIAVLGKSRLASWDRADFLKSHGIDCPNMSYWIESVGANCIGGLMQIHSTLWLTLGSCVDMTYGHAVILHEGQLYDPFHGMNPSWRWDRSVVMATPVKRSA